MSNPTTMDFPSRLRPASDLFNALYGLVFVTMGEIFSGKGNQPHAIGTLYALMSRCLTPVARYLVKQPINKELHAAPTFERYPFNGDPWIATSDLALSVARDHPELAGTCDLVSNIHGERR